MTYLTGREGWQEEGCEGAAHWGHEDDGLKVHCAAHKEEGEVPLDHSTPVHAPPC